MVVGIQGSEIIAFYTLTSTLSVPEEPNSLHRVNDTLIYMSDL